MNSHVLVTGGTGTLGAPLVQALVEKGFQVTANYSRDKGRALELQQRCGCALARANVCIEEDVERLFASNSFDAIVHCAGWNWNELVLKTTTALWDDVVKSQLEAAFLVTRASLRTLPARGNLVLVASRVGLIGNTGQSAYASAKAGMVGLMRTASLEGRTRDIRVNALCPGYAVAESFGPLASAQQERRSQENLIPESEARESFAAFLSWFLRATPLISGQILRPDCRI